MSAQSAPDANHFLAEIRLPGIDRTYEVRDVLRGMGLRWDPATHAWHGRLIAAQCAFLERRYGLAARVVVPIEAFEPAQVAPTLPPVRPRPPSGPRGPPRDDLQTNPSGSSHSRSFVPGTRTRVEARVAFPTPGGEQKEFVTADRTFSLLKITSGFADDSREEEERREERRLRDLRWTGEVVRAVIANTPGLAEILASDRRKAARFNAWLRITEAMFRRRGPSRTTSDLSQSRSSY